MLKVEPKSNTSTENGRLPRESDFKLPKKLDELTKRRIETGQAVLKGLREAYKNEQKSKG